MKILLATDGSVYAQHAIEHVADLVSRLKEPSDVVVVYVKDVGSMMVTVPTEIGTEVFFDVEQTQQVMDQNAENALAAAKAVLAASGANVTLQAIWGRPADVIIETADAEAVDLIALGSSGMSHLTGVLLGSISDRVLHHTKRPVLIVRGASES